jgi:hypothetical protein
MKGTTMKVTCNTDQKLYVIENVLYVSTLGFDYAFELGNKIAEWLGLLPLSPELVGTMAGYNEYRDMLNTAKIYCEEHGVRCPVELEPQLIGLEGWRVEVTGEYRTGGTYKERFIVGRSTGWMPAHIALPQRNSRYGGTAPRGPYTSVKKLYQVREGFTDLIAVDRSIV